MWLVSLQMRGGVSINEIFSIKWIYYGPKGDILDYWETLVFFNPIIPYQRMKVYRIERNYMGRFRRNNDVSGKLNPNKYDSSYCTG